MKIFLPHCKLIACAILCFSGLSSCTEVEVIYPEEKENISIENIGGNVDEIETDNGEIGALIDVRSINRKGYSPKTVNISFPNYRQYDSTLEVDEILNITKFNILNDSLTPEEKEDFKNGVMTEIEIYDGQQLLASYSGEIDLDDSNNPISFETDLDYIPKPISLKKDLPYLMMFRYEWGGLNYPSDGVNTMESSLSDLLFEVRPFDPIEMGPLQSFYFRHVEGNRYNIRLPAICQDFEGNVIECPPNNFVGYQEISSGGWITMVESSSTPEVFRPYLEVSEANSQVAEFELVENEDGWIEMFYIDGNSKLQPWTDWVNGNLWFGNGLAGDINAEIRLVSDNVSYNLEDLGTRYYEPIIPAVKADFAFWSTISNCSSTSITEEVGRIQTITRETSMATTESLQLFSSETLAISGTIEVGFEAQAGGGEATGGSYAQINGKVSVTAGGEWSTTTTRTTERMIQETVTEEIEVSRLRTVSVAPYSGIEVFDYIKKVDNVRIPFIKTYKITGRDKFFNSDLSGEELVSLFVGNLFGGVISRVEQDYIEVTIRGYSLTNSFFESFSGANDLANPCSD
jgi:hypothetical protein